MTILYIGLFILVLCVIVVSVLNSLNPKLIQKYTYKKREHLLTDAEREFYSELVHLFGSEYNIFSQVHLSSLVEYVGKEDSWKAWAHIGQKSVDFVLCDKVSLGIRLAIEVDDKTHSRSDRRRRDSEVQAILHEAGIKLVRFDNRGSFNSQEISEKIKAVLI